MAACIILSSSRYKSDPIYYTFIDAQLNAKLSFKDAILGNLLYPTIGLWKGIHSKNAPLALFTAFAGIVPFLTGIGGGIAVSYLFAADFWSNMLANRVPTEAMQAIVISSSIALTLLAGITLQVIVQNIAAAIIAAEYENSREI